MAAQGDIEAEFELYHGPELPDLAAHVWGWWLDLSTTRGSSGFGPQPLNRREVSRWEEDEGVGMAPWERRAIFRVDAAWRASIQPRDEEG